MHNRIKALIVAAMVITNTVSPTLEVLANELEMEKVSEEITNTSSVEEKTKDNLTLDIEEKTEDNITLDSDEKSEESLLLDQTNLSEENSNAVTKGVKKLEIESNTGAFDWGYSTSNEVAVLVEFDDRTAKKVVEIELTEGMAFNRYSVIGTPSNSVESEATPTELSVIKNVLEKPTEDSVTGQYSGKLVYELQEGVASGKIVFNVSVDRYKYYNPKEISNAIKVTVKENDVEVSSKSINVQAEDNTSIGAKNNSLNYTSSGRTVQLQPGGTGDTYSYYRNTTSTVQTGDNGIRDFTYIKSAELTMYYPVNTTLVSVNKLPDGATYIDYPSENKVVIKMDSPTIQNSNISLTYKVNDDASFGIAKAPHNNTMKVKYYDGNTEVLTAKEVDSVDIVDPNLAKSVIEMTVQDGYYHDYNGKSLSISGYIYLENKTIKEYNDQIFEYKFSDWNTRKVLLPDSMTGIKNIKYKLFGDTTEYTVDNSELVDFQGSQRLVDADALGIDEGKYFEKVTFEVENIPVGFDDSTNGRNNKLAISFGELPTGIKEGSTTVKIYPKGNEAAGTTIVKPIKRVDKPEKIAISSANTSLKNDENKEISNSFNQKVLKVKTSFDANKGFNRIYNFSNYLENPEIIIRMPKGFHLSTQTIKLTQNAVPKKYAISERTSTVDGSQIFTLQTEDVKIGGFEPETLAINPAIYIEFDFVTDATVNGKYDINDMIFIGKKGSHIDEIYLNSGILVQNDSFDLIQGDKLNGVDRSLGRTQTKAFEIIETNDLVVTTHIRDYGSSDDKQPYNKDDESTAIQVSKGTLIDFIVKVENNYERDAEDFEVYIPIPKKGVNMGSEVQMGQFNWDMELQGNAVITVKDKDGNTANLADLFEVTYGFNINGGSSYDTNYTTDKDVIRVVAKRPIEPGVVGEIKFTFKSSDNVSQSDVGSLNVFNAYYRRKYDNGAIDIRLTGNYVGLRLAIGQVKGIAFLDKNNDGLYTIGTDELLDNITVELFDKSTNTLVATTVTKDGEYKFEGLANGEYEVRVKNNGNSVDAAAVDAKRFTKLTSLSGQSYKNDSDIVSTDNINGSISISIPTNSHVHDINDYVNIGFVEPTKITIRTDGNGTVSGNDSESYMVWPFTTIQDPGTVTANTGYSFVNYTNSSGAIFTFPSEVNSDIEIKANFEKIIYKITLDSNGGTDGTVVEKEIAFDNLIKESLDSLTGDELPTRNGYKLIGWSTTKDRSGLITDTDTMGAAQIRLYAIWDKAPEIKGATDITIKEGDKFVALDGVEAIDEEDGTITNIFVVGEVKSDTPGKYTLLYSVEDKAGNVTAVTRVVTVDGAPEIKGVGNITIPVGKAFDALSGVTVEDKEDDENNLQVKLEVFGDKDVDVSTPGKYTVTYKATDSLGNETIVERIVTVDGAPVINGVKDILITARPDFDLLDGITASDKEDQNVKIDVNKGNFDPSVPGVYEIIYTVEDTAGNVTTEKRTITVDGAPVINGVKDITITARPDFDLLDGITASDKEDQNVKIDVNKGNFDPSVPGVYEIIYTVEDTAGNVTTEKRTITVDGAPVINGVKDITITARPDFDLLDGITASDKEDQNVKIDVNKGNFDPSVPGVYEIIYIVKDTAGNETTVKRIITVDGAPVIDGVKDILITARPDFDLLDGITASDKEDQDVTINVYEGDFKSDVPGSYEIVYEVIDTAGNITTVKRIITVDGAPVIEGVVDTTIRAGEEFDPLAGITATDKEDQNVTIVVSGDKVDVKTPGKYEVIYTVTDTAGNVTTEKRVVTVYGTPVITGADDLAIKVNDTFNELENVVAKDTEGNELSISVIENTVDIKNAGKYKVIYEVKDAAGNVITVEREVTVYGTPVITGAIETILKLGSEFNPLDGVVATDTQGKELSVLVSGKVDVNKPGEYILTYTATDILGNVTTVDRLIMVEGIIVEDDDFFGDNEENPDINEENPDINEENPDINEENPEIKDENPDINEENPDIKDENIEINKENQETNEEKPEINKDPNLNNLNTGDKGAVSYLLLAISSMIGLLKTKKNKKE